MEPVEAEIGTRGPTGFKVETTIKSLELHIRKVWTGGIGKEATFEDMPLGWYGHFEGSRESIFLGHEQPGLIAGDRVTITIEKVR